jgi:hypothetical protein
LGHLIQEEHLILEVKKHFGTKSCLGAAGAGKCNWSSGSLQPFILLVQK